MNPNPLLIILLLIHSAKFISGQTIIQDKNNPVVAAEMMNNLWLGVKNPVHIAVPNYSCEALLVSATNGMIEGKDCMYTIIPVNTGPVVIKVMTMLKGDTVIFGEKIFRVKRYPIHFSLCNRKGKISQKEILDCTNPEVGLYTDADAEPGFRIIQFDMIVNRTIKLSTSNGELTDEMKDLMRRAKVGDLIQFEKIKAISLDAESVHMKVIVELENIELNVE